MIGAERERDYLLMSLLMNVWKKKRQLRFSGCMHRTLNPPPCGDTPASLIVFTPEQ